MNLEKLKEILKPNFIMTLNLIDQVEVISWYYGLELTFLLVLFQ